MAEHFECQINKNALLQTVFWSITKAENTIYFNPNKIDFQKLRFFRYI